MEILAPIAVTIPAIAGLSFFLAPSPVYSQTVALHNVSAQTLQGTHESEQYVIKVSKMTPVNLSFGDTGEVIQQVWLNDPSRVNLSFFGCLASDSFGNSACSGQQQGTQIIHLQQFNQQLLFDSNFTQETDPILTLITINSSGTSKIYQIKLQLIGSEAPPYAVINVLPNAPPSPAQYELVTTTYQREVLQQLSQGLAIAEAKGLVDTESLAYESLRSMIALMQSGASLSEAIQQTNTPRGLVDQIRSMGN